MKTFFTILFAFLFSTAFAQKTEFRLALNSGLFHFAGASAESNSTLFLSDFANQGSTSNPYGTKPGLCYGLSLNVKRVEGNNFFYGVDVGVEMLQSKIQIDTIKISGFDLGSPGIYAAEGRSLLQNFFFNVNPFAGYRFAVKNIECDLAGGFDFGYCVFSNESAKATASDRTIHAISGSRKTMGLDFRPRIQLDANYKRFGAYLGYSIGLSNYKTECYARLFRFGLTYRLK